MDVYKQLIVIKLLILPVAFTLITCNDAPPPTTKINITNDTIFITPDNISIPLDKSGDSLNVQGLYEYLRKKRQEQLKAFEDSTRLKKIKHEDSPRLVKISNENYYEARLGRVTYFIDPNTTYFNFTKIIATARYADYSNISVVNNTTQEKYVHKKINYGCFFDDPEEPNLKGKILISINMLEPGKLDVMISNGFSENIDKHCYNNITIANFLKLNNKIYLNAKEGSGDDLKKIFSTYKSDCSTKFYKKVHTRFFRNFHGENDIVDIVTAIHDTLKFESFFYVLNSASKNSDHSNITLVHPIGLNEEKSSIIEKLLKLPPIIIKPEPKEYKREPWYIEAL